MSKRLPSFLVNEDLQLLFFGGKGGAGKTTSAAAVAIYLAQLRRKKQILVASTDPAHSLGDSLGCQLGDRITPIKGIDNLWALEINAKELYNDFRKKYEDVIKKIIDRGTMLDEEDISQLYSLSLPGLDEVMAIMKIAHILKDGRYDLIILDTAPTGHTIKLLSLPEQMGKFFNVFDLMLAKHRYLSRQFTGRYKKDDADEFVETMTRDMTRVKSLLSSPLTEFVPVTIPEPMSIYETERLLTTLEKQGITVKNIIVNRVAGEEKCPFCESRKSSQEAHIREIDKKFASYNLIMMPLFPYEIQGMKDLTEFGEILFGDGYKYRPIKPTKLLPQILSRPFRKPSIFRTEMSDILKKDLQFVLFGGKGGVGKTSLAAATALSLARYNPDKKILLFSTDPAHSLSDSFGFPIGDKITSIKGVDNLYALEIDAAGLYQALKDGYKADMEEVINKSFGKGINLKFDREVMFNLIEISPPGLDEIMALEKIIEFVENDVYDVYILDTAPTGHLLRFLELPDLVREWLKTIFRILLKYRNLVRIMKLEEKLLKTAKCTRKIREVLIDSERSEFVAITIPEAMGVSETERLLSSLRNLGIPCHHVVINMIIPPTRCSFCASERKEQQEHVRKIKNIKFPEHLVTQVPLFPHEIRGMDDLTKLGEVMYG